MVERQRDVELLWTAVDVGGELNDQLACARELFELFIPILFDATDFAARIQVGDVIATFRNEPSL